MGLIRKMAAIAAGRTTEPKQQATHQAAGNTSVIDDVKAALAARGIEQTAPASAPKAASATDGWQKRFDKLMSKSRSAKQ